MIAMVQSQVTLGFGLGNKAVVRLANESTNVVCVGFYTAHDLKCMRFG